MYPKVTPRYPIRKHDALPLPPTSTERPSNGRSPGSFPPTPHSRCRFHDHAGIAASRIRTLAALKNVCSLDPPLHAYPTILLLKQEKTRNRPQDHGQNSWGRICVLSSITDLTAKAAVAEAPHSPRSFSVPFRGRVRNWAALSHHGGVQILFRRLPGLPGT